MVKTKSNKMHLETNNDLKLDVNNASISKRNRKPKKSSSSPIKRNKKVPLKAMKRSSAPKMKEVALFSASRKGASVTNEKEENKAGVKDDAGFMLLPEEMKLQIFSHLSPQDLQAVSTTCKDFHRLSQDPSLWTELTVDISESRRTMLWKVAKCPWLNTLKISNKNGIDLKSQHFKIASISRRFQFVKLIWLETGVVVNSGIGWTG